MTTHSSILAWRVPRTEKPDGLVHGVAKSQTRLSDSLSLSHTHTHTHTKWTVLWVLLRVTERRGSEQ